MWIHPTGFDHDVYDEFENMRRQIGQLFGDWAGASGIRSVAAGTFPAVNVGASPTQVDVYLFAAGADPDSLDIKLQQNLLSVSGSRTIELPEQAQRYRHERFSGDFRRVITLPEDVDPEKVDAIYRDGILHITVQRREAVRPRRIDIH